MNHRCTLHVGCVDLIQVLSLEHLYLNTCVYLEYWSRSHKLSQARPQTNIAHYRSCSGSPHPFNARVLGGEDALGPTHPTVADAFAHAGVPVICALLLPPGWKFLVENGIPLLDYDILWYQGSWTLTWIWSGSLTLEMFVFKKRPRNEALLASKVQAISRRMTIFRITRWKNVRKKGRRTVTNRMSEYVCLPYIHSDDMSETMLSELCVCVRLDAK